MNDPVALQEWIDSNPTWLKAWNLYNREITPYSPENAIRPTQTAILVSRDNGESWEILMRFPESEYHNRTIISRSTGFFRNGEMSFVIDDQTFVISEGYHKYTNNGVDCSGDILIKLNENSTIVTPILI